MQNNFQEMMTCEAKDDKNKMKMWIQQIIKVLERNHVESSTEVLRNTGHNLDDEKKVTPANEQEAMADESQL